MYGLNYEYMLIYNIIGNTINHIYVTLSNHCGRARPDRPSGLTHPSGGFMQATTCKINDLQN